MNGTAGGPSGKDIFDLKFVLVETFLLLFSSITYGMAMIAMNKGKVGGVNTAVPDLPVWSGLRGDGNL